MKKYKGWIIFVLFIGLCFGGVKFMLEKTAEYPGVGEAVSYEVNQLEGFELSIEEPTWAPNKGYTIRYAVATDTEDVYTITTGTNPPADRLERQVDGVWHSLQCNREEDLFEDARSLGGSGHRGYQASLVQVYDGYGNRLEPGLYRFTIELTDQVGDSHYLSAQFEVE